MRRVRKKEEESIHRGGMDDKRYGENERKKCGKDNEGGTSFLLYEKHRVLSAISKEGG